MERIAYTRWVPDGINMGRLSMDRRGLKSLIALLTAHYGRPSPPRPQSHLPRQRYTSERPDDAIVSFGLPFHVGDLRIWGIPAHSDSVRAYPRSVQRMHALGPGMGCGQGKEDRVVKV